MRIFLQPTQLFIVQDDRHDCITFHKSSYKNYEKFSFCLLCCRTLQSVYRLNWTKLE